jgi:AraC family transcriptional regulator, arabinose operon regulatory protein
MDWKPSSRIDFRWGSVFECEYDWTWRVRGLPSWDLWYVTSGKGWIADRKSRTEISFGDCVLLRSGVSYRSWHDPEQPLRFIAIHFEFLDEWGERLRLAEQDYPPFIRRIGLPELFRELLTRAIDSYREGRQERAAVWLQTALMEMLRQDATEWPAGLLGEQARKIDEICRRIRAHPGRPVRIDDLASELYVTPEHFSRIFRRLHGISPRAFVTRTRIEAAQNLLINSGHSIGRISDLLGYENPFYFSRQFKSQVGVSPSAFRKDDRNGTVIKTGKHSFG